MATLLAAADVVADGGGGGVTAEPGCNDDMAAPTAVATARAVLLVPDRWLWADIDGIGTGDDATNDGLSVVDRLDRQSS